MTIEEEIEKASRQVSTDSFSLTIGEICNMYRDGDIVINPNFQRLFRWDIERKSRLIESVLVRIPLPPIFIFERQNSKWEVIDGLQRLSSILEFMGELKNPDGGKYVPKAMIGTQYIPSLRGAFWSKETMEARLAEDHNNATDYTKSDDEEKYFLLSEDLKRQIKRTKVGIQLLEKKSDEKSKYDLFQRLNSGGMIANDQELRNCALVMVSPQFFTSLKEIAEGPLLTDLIPLGNNSIKKSNHLENASKVMAFSFSDYIPGTDIEEFVTNAMVSIAMDDVNYPSYFTRMSDTISLLIQSCGKNALRPYRNGQFVGRIGRTSQEVILVGAIRNYDNIQSKSDPAKFVRDCIIDFWESDEASKFTAAGIAGTERVKYTIARGKELFSR